MRSGKLLALRRIDAAAEEFSDEALIASCALGDSAAMGALIDRFHRPLYRFVSRMIGSDGGARDDLVQAAFAEIATCAGKFRGTSSVQVWIFGIAANLARNHIRSAVRRRRLELAFAEIPPRCVTAPDREVEHRETMARLAAAIGELPAQLREAFVLCDLEDVSCRDAATTLGVREGTIWRRVHDARRSLRESLRGGS